MLSKLMEHIIYSNVFSRLTKNSYLTPSQHGFRKGKRLAVFHAPTVHKLLTFNLPTKIIAWMTAYLHQRKQSVLNKHEHSSPRTSNINQCWDRFLFLIFFYQWYHSLTEIKSSLCAYDCVVYSEVQKWPSVGHFKVISAVFQPGATDGAWN